MHLITAIFQILKQLISGMRNRYESVGVKWSAVEMKHSACGCQQVFRGALNSAREY
jgi:hypothetical protein